MVDASVLTPFKDFLRSADPLVSVVIPSYNKGPFLAECVESVLAQSYAQIEVIIVNDGSSDDTAVVARRLIEKNPGRGIQFINKPNGGVSDARNAGFRAASARVVMTIDGDDLLTPSYVETAVRTLRETGGDLFFSNQENFGLQAGEWVPNPYDPFFIRYDNCIPIYAVFDKRLFDLTGGFKVGLGYAEDWEFWVNCSRHRPLVVRSDERLVRYRMNDQGIASSFIEGRWRDCVVMVMISNSDLYSIDEVLEAHAHYPSSAQPSLERTIALERIHPAEPLLKFLLALQADARGEKQQALDLFLQVLKLTGNNHWQAAYRAAEILRAAGQLNDAKPVYHLVRTLRPDMSRIVKTYCG